MKNYFLSLCFLFLVTTTGFSQFSLYNTRTLYDSFENPAQKAFYADTSRTYAFNFFIPNFSVNATILGPAQTTFKSLLFGGKFNTSDLELGSNAEMNKIYFNENAYLAMFKIFKGAKFNQEIGFAWQIRSYGNVAVSNETLALFNNYNLLSQSADNRFNNSGTATSYHQFAFTFREDYNKRLGLGIKLSYLSGIAHSKLQMEESSLAFNETDKTYAMALRGTLRSNFLLDDPDKTLIVPGFKNPGAALSLSANYKLKRGFTLLANVKDLGFIYWSKTPYKFTIDKTVQFTQGEKQSSINSKLKKDFFKNPDSSKFKTPINSRVELLVNKDLGSYQPNLLISKNLFEKGGDIALINTYRHRALNLSLSTAYNLHNYFQVGGQFMLKSPNAEFFIGSDQIFENYYTAKGVLTSDEKIGKGKTAASVYFGFAIKYGDPKQRRQNTNFIPVDDRDFKEGFFKRLYKRIFKRKRFEGQRE
ncbi:DUF5723 family protein [Paradesertivirga mongoliensis]|uniref:DUF5723 family protein n=1 Tax=Paradesertivirga mongoliensis TaxID=2100740 RepID=A0ABW4ZRT3_9SPHI|nr:DUF5723 family protein [Pedobacter mongoliensis]